VRGPGRLGTSTLTASECLLRTFVTFRAHFPDDGLFDNAGNPTRPGGKNVAETIANCLRENGLDVSDVTQYSFYGWQFVVSVDGESFAFLLQYPEPWLLLSDRVGSLLDRLRGPPAEAAHRKVLELLSMVLSRDNRFMGQSWFTKDDYERDSSGPRHERP
jgi:hypothetical protein